MLVTTLGLYKAGAIRKTPTPWTIFVALVIFVAAIVHYVGTCTIFSRTNPNLSPAVRLLGFLLLLLFADVYLVWFVLRMGIAGMKRQTIYKTLPHPAKWT